MRPEEIGIIIETLPLPVLVVGTSQTVIAANETACTLLGDHVVGRHYITALRQPNVLEAIENVARTGAVSTTRYLSSDNGKDTTFRVHVSPVAGLQLLVFQDTSDAEDISQMRRDFVANVSHELRTPLTALMGFIETLQGNAQSDPEAQKRFLTIMKSEAERMIRIVEDLLSLSRVEAEERVRPLENVDLGSLIRASLNELAPVIENSECEIDYKGNCNSVTVPADAAQLRQVIGNLIENALKYGASGRKISLSLLGPSPEPSLRADSIRFSVTDYGDGIEDHHLARLTERFYRVDSHRSRAIGGTGLGLAIVKHIVNRHRGRLKIESSVGQGTTVTVILPVK